jgi:exopolyphosphatase/guanosine-5'-triphosphate,3'-diphosphate pyrophosphatase
MPRYAAIDIGSNSVRLLVAETAAGTRHKLPSIATLHAGRSVTRLGSSVFQTGRLSEEAIATVCAQLEHMAAAYRKLEVSAVRAVATAAVRDASNQHEFIERASKAAGAQVKSFPDRKRRGSSTWACRRVGRIRASASSSSTSAAEAAR